MRIPILQNDRISDDIIEPRAKCQERAPFRIMQSIVQWEIPTWAIPPRACSTLPSRIPMGGIGYPEEKHKCYGPGVVPIWERDGNHETMDEAMLTLERALADWMEGNKG